MKKFFKWVMIVIVAIVVINIATGGDDETAEPTTKTVEAEPKETAAKEEPKAEAPAPKEDKGISKAEFDEIQNGMSYEEVTKIIGVEGEVNSETGEKGTQFHTIMYSYEGEKGWGSNAIMTFQNNKLQNKTQMGLE